MNIRKVYLGLIAVLSMALFYEWTSGGRADAVEAHLEMAKFENLKPRVSDDGLYVYLENELLKLKIAIQTGAVVESRLKEYGVENVEGSMGVRVLARQKQGTLGIT